MSNPLVAQAQSQTTGVTGIGIAESAVDLANGVSDGSWVEAGLGAVGVGLEVLSMVVDPIGTLASYGVSWLIEHVQPLKEALDWLAGDPPVIQSFSETWANVAAEVNAIAGDLGNEVTNGTAGWQGEGADAYRGAAAEQADALAGAASLADGISAGVMIMGTVVAAVRELVRDLVAELVGKLIAWALEAAATLGFATPVIAAQATAAITKTISKISEFIRKLVKTIGNVSPKIRKIIDKLGEIIEKLSKMLRKGGKPGGGTTPSSAKTPPKSPDTPNSPNSPDTTPSSADTTPSGADTPGSKPSDGTTPSSAKDPDTNRPDNPQNTKTPENSRNKCNDPIDVVSGEMIIAQSDVELDGVLPLVLTRTHVSSYRAGRAFGRSWASTVDQRLEFDERGVVFVAEDGMLLVYPEPPVAGAVLPEAGPRWPLARTEHGFQLTRTDTDQLLHFPAGSAVSALATVMDRNGNRIDFERDGDGVLIGVHHSGGYHLDVANDGGRITGLSLRNPDGEPIVLLRYDYSAAGNLTGVVNSSNRAMRFDYDHAGRITQWTDRNGEWYRYFYDADGRCVANQGSGGFLNGTFTYDTENRITRFTDSLGNITAFHYNEARQLVREIDPLGGEVRQEWDAFDRLLARTDALGRVTRYRYDEAGNVLVETRPDGTQALTEYNSSGQPLVRIEPDGGVWRFTYDERENLLSTTDPAGARTQYAYDDRGGLTAVTDALGQVHRIECDATGLPVRVVDPQGAVTAYTRDVFGRVAAISDPVGGTTRLGWTVEGKPASRVHPDGSVERWLYDGEGNETRYLDVLGRETRIETTHFDRPSVQIGPDGSRVEFRYDTNVQLVEVINPQGASWRYDYDAAGRLIRETDFNGRVVAYHRDAAGQLTARTNGLGQRVELERDASGNVVECRYHDGTRAAFEFDPVGRLMRAVNADAEVSYVRDAAGRVVQETVNGRTLESVYDLMGRRRRRITPAGAVSEWDYDANGNAVSLRTAGRTITFGYDQAGREVERLVDTGTILAQAWDASHRVAAQTVSTVAIGGRSAQVLSKRAYRYRADGFVSAIEDSFAGLRSFELDPVGRVTGVRSAAGAEQYGYDPAGNLAAGAWPGSVSEAHGRREFHGTLLTRAGNVRYHYDAQGRVTHRQRKRLSAKPENWHYEWNADDRLVGVMTPDGVRWRYRYDALGRRVAKQRIGDDGVSVTESVDFTWDGEVLAEQHHSGGAATTWDFEPDSFRPVTQVDRTWSQVEVDTRFYSMITDLVGAPVEMVDSGGNLVWRFRSNLWGEQLTDGGPAGTPLRFPGQYHDSETGLNYNYQRYFAPETGRYLSSDPLGLDGGINPHAYVSNPVTLLDPLGLKDKSCWENAVRHKGSATPAGKLTANQQRDLAKFVGLKPYNKKPNVVKGQPVFTDGKRVYVYDNDGHNGGLFKKADSVADLGSKRTREGTYGLGRPAGSNDPWQLFRVGD
ncbi:DUF6531 domain-containing protein [Saccharothrix sp. AJ9571]|nr:DUF6531 domain-containing protein [Saccharothrix sp. AJ9571]